MHQNPMEQKRIDDIADEWQRWGRASATEQWARCYRCLHVEPVDGKHYCEACLLLPPVVIRMQTWNGFQGTPNPKPWKMLRVPYDKPGQWEEWMEYEPWVAVPHWRMIVEKVLLRTYLYRVRNWWRRLATQTWWDDERQD